METIAEPAKLVDRFLSDRIPQKQNKYPYKPLEVSDIFTTFPM